MTYKTQKGSSFIIALMLLVVASLLGITAMQSSIVQERMHGNLRDHQLAFEAAEAAIRDAEEYLKGIGDTSSFIGMSGLYGINIQPPDMSSTWDDNNSRVYSKAIPGVKTKPKYRIIIDSVFCGAKESLNISSYGQMKNIPDTTSFKIIARGTGGSDNSVVYLDEYYNRKVM